MRKTGLIISASIIAALTLAACNGQLIYERVVTATPNPDSLVITITPGGTAQAAASPAVVIANASTPEPATPTALPVTLGAIQATAQATTPAPTESGTLGATQSVAQGVTQSATQGVAQGANNVTATLIPSPTLSAFPTDTRADLYIAQEDFEHGYVFWISTQKTIWVLLAAPGNANPTSGEWRSYPDTWDQNVDPALDPNLVPPPSLYQPRRGFGKLWRNTPGLRDALGWATTPEFDLNTKYVYQPGGYLDQNGKYVAGPGKHFLTSLDRKVFVMIEPAPGGTGRWERGG